MPGTTSSDTETRLPGLDLLRAIAIVWVMLFHYANYGPPLPGIVNYGWMGVDLFFVLSGYLIGWQVLKPYTRGARPLWKQFFLRRAFRILPAYLAVLALYFSVPAFREREGIQPLWQFLTFTENLFADYFRNQAFSHVWSLCVEEHFYLLLPPVLWLLARKPSAGRIAAAALAVLVGGIVLRAWIWQNELAPIAHLRIGPGNFFQRYIELIYYPTYTRLDGLLAGVMLAVVRGFRPAWWAWAMARGWLFLALGLAGVGASIGLFQDLFGHAGAVVGFPLLSIGLALVVVAAISPRSLRLPGAGPIAAMAFSLYLTHKQAYHWIHESLGARLEDSDLLAFFVYNGAALAIGALLYVTVERPGLRLRGRFLKPAQRGELPRAA